MLRSKFTLLVSLDTSSWAFIIPGGGGGTLIFSYIRRLGSFFWFKISNFNMYWVYRKMNIFRCMKILWIFFGGHHKIELYLGVISMHFMVFS